MESLSNKYCPIYKIVPASWDSLRAFLHARSTRRDLYQRGPNGARIISAVPVIGYQKIIMGAPGKEAA